MSGRRRVQRACARLTVLLTSLILLLSVSPGAWATPAGQLDPLVDEMRRQVSQVRGLPVLADTPLVVLPRPALVERLSVAVNTERAVREFLTSQMLLEVLGAMERGFDLRELQLRILAEQTLAIYDYDQRAILLAADAADELSTDARLVLAHELTHALQDQHFDLRRVLPADTANSDAAMAARALVEGDAMLTMRIWGRQFLRPTEKRALGGDAVVSDPVLDAAPPLVRGELLFPYDAGWVFAQLLYQDAGFAALDRAFARPPRSTEQILHPEKYAAGEEPLEVAIPPLELGLGGSWQTLRTDVFGELVLRLLLEPNVGWPTAEAAAAGWGGDAYTILEDAGGRRIVGMVTAWDTESDAAQFYNAFVASIPAQHQSAQQRTLALPSQSRWSVPEYHVQALKTDNVVRILYAPDAVTLERADALLADATVRPAGPGAPRPSSVPRPTPGPTPSPPPSPGQPPADATPGAPVAPEREPADEPAPATTPAPTVTPDAAATPAPTGPAPGRPAAEDEEPPSEDDEEPPAD